MIFILVGYISYKNDCRLENKLQKENKREHDIESDTERYSDILPNNTFIDKPITVYKMEYRSRNASL